jgi:hypothetical protein
MHVITVLETIRAANNDKIWTLTLFWRHFINDTHILSALSKHESKVPVKLRVGR